MDNTHSASGRDDRLITSLDNPTIRFARNLHRRRFRYREQAILVEGVRSVRTALDHGAVLHTLLIDERQYINLDAETRIHLASNAGRTLLVGGAAFDSIVDTEHPQAVVAICSMPVHAHPTDASLILALDAVRDPGNLGTLCRTAAAAGADGVALLPGCVDPFNPKTVRSSAGLIYALPVFRASGVSEVRTACYPDLPQVAIADAGGDIGWDECNWRRPTVLILGGEAGGVSEEVRTYADFVVSLPMAKKVESLNVAAAGAALLFEIVRQRQNPA